ncbi:MAG TPA: DUF3221 domain-containing protein [Pseudoneobacillus sp.]|nr:DUF3221 domain-containing protein [Pseudoneobacillus sp.]
MKKLLFFLLISCLPLVGCGERNADVKGAFDIKGIVSEIDKENNQILVKDSTTGLIRITLPANIQVEKYNKGQEVVIWLDGEIKESSPAQANALNIELLDNHELNNSLELPTFNFGNEFPPSSPGFIQVEDTRYEMAKGGYRWKKGNSVVLTDAASPLQIAENFKPIEVAPNSIATIEIGQNPNVSTYTWSGNTKASYHNIKENRITMPAIKGQYIYEVTAKWTNGEVSYTFVVDIK